MIAKIVKGSGFCEVTGYIIDSKKNARIIAHAGLFIENVLKTEVGKAGNWKELIAGLNEKGVDVRFKYKGKSDEVQGVVFIMNGYSFSGSKIDRQFSYSKIDAALKTSSYSETERLVAVQSEPAYQQEPHGYELYSGSSGLFTPNPQPEQPEGYLDDYLRKKKKKKQRKIRW